MNKYAKAIVGSLIAGLGSVDTAYTDNVFTMREGVKAAIVVLTTLYVVYLVPNSTGDSEVNPVIPVQEQPTLPVEPVVEPVVSPVESPAPVVPVPALIVPTESIQ